MVITAVSYPGERLERSGRAFVMDRICMHTPRLSLHSGYEQTRHSHTHSEAHFLFFPLNLMVENSAAAHTLFHWASCHLKPVLTASVLRITSTHTHTHTDTSLFGGNVQAWWCILHIFHADCPCVSDASEWDLEVSDQSNTSHPNSPWIKCGGKTMALYWSCPAESPLRKKKKQKTNTHIHTLSHTHTHTHGTAICHGCRQPGHHLPLQMGQNTQNNRLREKERDEQRTTA